MKTPQTIVLFWDGPYSVKEVKELNRAAHGNGFYLFVGTLKNGEANNKNIKALNYCGMTTRSFGIRIYEHEQSKRFDDFEGDVEVWLGNCEQPANPDEQTLRRVEKMLIKGWDVEGNSQGKVGFPTPMCLVMRWYFRDWRPRKQRPAWTRDLPDVLWFENGTWWMGKLRVHQAS